MKIKMDRTKTKRHLRRITIFTITSVIGLLLIAPSSNAANGVLYFDPGSVSLQNQGTFTVQVHSNYSASSYNAAQINLSYDPSSLQYISYSLNGSAMPNAVGYTASSGSVGVALYVIGNVTGDQLLASFTFKALKDSGSSAVSFASGSALVNAGQSLGTLGANLGVTFTNSANNTAPQDKEKPQLISSSVTGYLGDVANIKIVTTEAVKVIVRFGEDKNRLLYSVSFDATSDTFYVPLGELSKSFTKGTDYYYTIELIDAAGNSTASDVQKFSASGEKVVLKIKDKDGKAMVNTTVVVNGKEFKTDQNGNVTIDSLLPGLLVVTVKDGDTELFSGEVTVVANVKDQTFEITPNGMVAGAEASKSLLQRPSLYGSLIALLGLIAGGVILLRTLRSHRLAKREERLHSANPFGNRPTTPLQQQPQLTISPTTTTPNASNDTTPVPSVGDPTNTNTLSPDLVVTPPTLPNDEQQMFADAAKKIVGDK